MGSWMGGGCRNRALKLRNSMVYTRGYLYTPWGVHQILNGKYVCCFRGRMPLIPRAPQAKQHDTKDSSSGEARPAPTFTRPPGLCWSCTLTRRPSLIAGHYRCRKSTFKKSSLPATARRKRPVICRPETMHSRRPGGGHRAHPPPSRCGGSACVGAFRAFFPAGRGRDTREGRPRGGHMRRPHEEAT